MKPPEKIVIFSKFSNLKEMILILMSNMGILVPAIILRFFLHLEGSDAYIKKEEGVPFGR